MKIQDIKTPGFITEPRLMGGQTDDGIGQIHYSDETLIEVSKDGYYMSAKGDLYYRNGTEWYVYDKEGKTYTGCPTAPFQSSR